MPPLCDTPIVTPSLKKSAFLQLFQLEKYGISTKTGFIPESLPLTRLSNYFEPWEKILDEFPAKIKSETLRDDILKLPLLDTDNLPDLVSKRRAFVVITFLSSAYIWGNHFTQSPLHVLPYVLARPLTNLAVILGLRPILCYTSVSLFNFRVPKLNHWEELKALHTFTGTEDESWFYMLPLAIEIICTPCIYAMLDCLDAIHTNEPHRIASCLETMDLALQDMLVLLPKMRMKCDPSTFFNVIRPFLSGWSHVPSTSSNPHGGVLFENIFDMPSHWSPIPTPRGNVMKSTGGSAGQTPTIQLLDAFLGIQHASNMYHEMRDYMPPGYRYFIEDIASQQSMVQKYLLRHPSLLPSFNGLIQKMTDFRNVHLKLVAQYIISQHSKTSSSLSNLKGTGNTSLIPFLKETRAETEQAVLHKLPQIDEP